MAFSSTTPMSTLITNPQTIIEMTHTILLTKANDPATNALLTIRTNDTDARVAFQKFHHALQHWLISSEVGEELEADSPGEFNIGDFMMHESIILSDDEFQSDLISHGVEFISCTPAGCRVPYERVLFRKPKPL